MQQVNGRESDAPRIAAASAWGRVTALLMAVLLTGSLAFAQEQGGSAIVTFQDDEGVVEHLRQAGAEVRRKSVLYRAALGPTG